MFIYKVILCFVGYIWIFVVVVVYIVNCWLNLFFIIMGLFCCNWQLLSAAHCPHLLMSFYGFRMLYYHFLLNFPEFHIWYLWFLLGLSIPGSLWLYPVLWLGEWAVAWEYGNLSSLGSAVTSDLAYLQVTLLFWALEPSL